MSSVYNATCIFCKIIKGEIPCHKLLETEHSVSFLDIQPLSKGHLLVIPKYHAQMLHQIPDNCLSDILIQAKQLGQIVGKNEAGEYAYNILQNNGKLAHQEVEHVHFHVIPKTENTGLGIRWPVLQLGPSEIKSIAEDIQGKLKK